LALARFCSSSFIAENKCEMIGWRSCVTSSVWNYSISQAVMITAATIWAILLWVGVSVLLHVRARRRREDEARWNHLQGG
jgi:hypothetical protein